MRAEFCTGADGTFVCGLCPHGCRISPGNYGRCGSRYNDGNELIACTYGKVSSLCIDPIEKKPLYHFHPGSDILSIGSIGCNMSCRHCQNHGISVPGTSVITEYVSPEELASICRREGLGQIAFTYNEPTIWYEYIRDFKRMYDGEIVLVTNGLASPEAFEDLCSFSDAMNIDVKGFTDDFYRKVCGAHLDDVLRSVKTAFEHKVHIEITYLLIPGHNDSENELRSFSKWVREDLSNDVPVHLTRFHPDHLMTDVPATPFDTMMNAKEIASEEGLNFVYLGNVIAEGAGDTFCPECGKKVVGREGFSVRMLGAENGTCPNCGRSLNMII